MNTNAQKTALITGANSGLGFEAAAQLADAGFARIILACRTEEKAEAAKKTLAERVGRDPYETLAVDVASIRSSEGAAAELIRRGHKLDALLLNAGMVSDDTMKKSEEGFELSFASSVIGHHVLSVRLLEADLLNDQARIVIAGSEAANADLPGMMDMKLYDFATGPSQTFGTDLQEAMTSFMRGDKPDVFRGTHYYSTAKLFSAWWSAAMARKFGKQVKAFTVSPGSNMGTNAGRNVTGFKKFLFTKVMPKIGGPLGMNMPTALGAKRYVDVLLDDANQFKNGRTYTSAPKKLVGPLHEVTYPHLLDVVRQEAAWEVLGNLTGTAEPSAATPLSATA